MYQRIKTSWLGGLVKRNNWRTRTQGVVSIMLQSGLAMSHRSDLEFLERLLAGAISDEQLNYWIEVRTMPLVREFRCANNHAWLPGKMRRDLKIPRCPQCGRDVKDERLVKRETPEPVDKS